jgi:hypothetical protein
LAAGNGREHATAAGCSDGLSIFPLRGERGAFIGHANNACIPVGQEAGVSSERSLQAVIRGDDADLLFRQALILWGIYIALAILLNGTVPFLLGRDVRAWTFSPVKDVLFNLVVYSLVFLVLPLVLAVGAMTLRTYIRPVAALAVPVLAWLHYRYDLSELGFRSRGWRADMVAVVLIALLSGASRFFSSDARSFMPTAVLLAALDRLLLNPASTTEYIFYFGFLAEGLSLTLGRWGTALVIGLMYGFHEMTNPEYWYEGQFFPMIFVGIALFALIYLWRRSVVVIWLGDGLGRFLGDLF